MRCRNKWQNENNDLQNGIECNYLYQIIKYFLGNMQNKNFFHVNKESLEFVDFL